MNIPELSIVVNFMDYINIPNKVKDDATLNINESQWKLFELYIGRYSSKYFQIYVYLDKTNNIVYMKPCRPYYDAIFEELFKFDIACEYYNENKIIQVTQPDYHLRFEKYFE